MITEQDIEDLMIEKLAVLGYVHTPAIELERAKTEVLLEPVLLQAMQTLNPGVPAHILSQALQKLKALQGDLLERNETFHNYLCNGISVDYQIDGKSRSDKVWLINYEAPHTNDFQVVSQLTVIQNQCNRRPDLVLYINGLPLVVVELKKPNDANATLQKAYHQHLSAKQEISELYQYNALLIVSDGTDARYGSLSAGWNRYMTWKTPDGIHESFVPELLTLVHGLLPCSILLDVLRHFVVFEKSSMQDEHGLTHSITVKKIAAYHQYYAVNKAIDSTLKATSERGDRKAGVIWHTQGSGKSLSMVFYTGKLVQVLNNPTVLVLTDRNDLDDQLHGTFSASEQLLRQRPKQATSRQHLQELLNVASGGIVFSTVQMFFPEAGEDYPTLSERNNIVVIADEAHRSQYGFKARLIAQKDSEGNEIGMRTGYGFAKYIRDALPNASFLGFTGTPIEKIDASTPAVFGDYIDIYDIARAIDDGATVPIYYESRLANVHLDETQREVLDHEEELLQQRLADDEALETFKANFSRQEAIIGHPKRLLQIAEDLVQHIETRQAVFAGKAMIVTLSRKVAAALYAQLLELRPHWGNDDLRKGKLKVVMTGDSGDEPALRRLKTSKQERQVLAERLKDPSDELAMVIVVDMWLTGFDAPCLDTLYIDKPMKGHNLMQAIARVNRVYKDKEGGLIVDYIGIADSLRKALDTYTVSGGSGKPTEDYDKALDIMNEQLDKVRALFHGFDYRVFFDAPMEHKLQLLIAATDFIQGVDDGKSRFMKEFGLLAKVHALAINLPGAQAVVEEVGFFQAIKARLQKFEPGATSGTGTNLDVETAIKQMVDKALVADGVIDIFAAAGLPRPDVSILSDSFLDEVQKNQNQNLAQAFLEKILKDEIRERSRRNRIQSKKLSERLEDALKKYRNKVMSTSQIIDELIKMAKDIRERDQRGEEMGLSEDELSFYDALADNESASELMGDQTLATIAQELVSVVRKNKSTDWSRFSDTQAKMRVLIKRILRRFDYPPDQTAEAVKNIIDQTETMLEDDAQIGAFQAGYMTGQLARAADAQRSQGAAESTEALPGIEDEQVLKAWIETLPLPLASILWQFHSVTDPKAQCEHLLHFFEAATQFYVTLLLSGPLTHATIYPPLAPLWMAQQKAGSLHDFKRVDFGLWTSMGFKIAKTLRVWLKASAAERQEYQALYHVQNLNMLSPFASKTLWNVLNVVRSLRNDWDGHGGLAGEAIYKARVEELCGHLNAIYHTTGSVFEEWQLIRPGSNEYYDETYHYHADILQGHSETPVSREMFVTRPMDKNTLYMYQPRSLTALPLIPFVHMQEEHRRYRCLFFSKFVKDPDSHSETVRWVSYHDRDTPDTVMAYPALRKKIDALLQTEL